MSTGRPGPVPYGHKPEHRRVIHRAVELRRWGASLRVICAVLDAEGHSGPWGAAWHPWRLAEVIRRELGEAAERYNVQGGGPRADGTRYPHTRRVDAPVSRELGWLAGELRASVDRMQADTVVAGVDVSGMSLSEALDALRPVVQAAQQPHEA